MRFFVTGASGWIGSAVVAELLGAGHRVVGLARSDASAAAVLAAGAEVRRGDLGDLDLLAATAAESDGVVHLAFRHDLAFTGDFEAAVAADRAAVQALGDGLSGTGRPLLVASGIAGVRPDGTATESDRGEPVPGTGGRILNELVTLALAERGVRAVVVRFPPTVHGPGDHGFIASVVAADRAAGTAAYVGDGRNRWPAVHVADAARLVRLAAEEAPAGTVLHAVGEEGVALRGVAEAIGRGLDLPVTSVTAEQAEGHFGFLAGFLGLDLPASSDATRALLAWEPTGPTILEDLGQAHYFTAAGSA